MELSNSDVVQKIVQDFLKERKFSNYNVHINGTSKKGDNYTGCITFITVTLCDTNNKTQNFEYIVKHATLNKNVRDMLPIRLAYSREIYMYEKIMPYFQQFEIDNGVLEPFDAVPKCYKTQMTDDCEYLILDDLKAKGYRMHDRQKPVTLDHLKLMAKQFGKWHALSFAARDQKTKEFTELSQGCSENILETFASDPNMSQSLNEIFDNICRILKANNELYILQQFTNDFKDKMHEILLEILRTKETNWVLGHSDCWINNFLFKYESPEATNPTDIAILDWQVCRIVSPVIDLLYFIYSTASGEELKHLKEILEIYHQSLCRHIQALGSDPEKLFPFDELKRHWNKYIKFPISFIPISFQVILCPQEELFGIDDIHDKDVSFVSLMSSTKPDYKLFDERILEMLRSCYTFKFE